MNLPLRVEQPVSPLEVLSDARQRNGTDSTGRMPLVRASPGLETHVLSLPNEWATS